MRRRPGLPVEASGKTHEESVSEAQHAINEGNKTLVTVGLLGDQVGDVADKLKIKKSRNHFSELIDEMLRSQGGGGTPAPKGG